MVDGRRCRRHRRWRCRYRLPDDEPCCRKRPLSSHGKLPDIGKFAGHAHPGATIISDIDDPEAYPNVCDPASCHCDAVGFTTQRDGVHVVWDDRPIPLLTPKPPRMDTGTYTVVVPAPIADAPAWLYPEADDDA